MHKLNTDDFLYRHLSFYFRKNNQFLQSFLRSDQRCDDCNNVEASSFNIYIVVQSNIKTDHVHIGTNMLQEKNVTFL